MLEFVFDCSICSVLFLCSTVPPKPTMAPHVPSAKGERNSRVWKPRKGYPNSLWFQEKSWYTLDKKKCDMAESPIFNIYRIDRSGFGQEKKSSCRNYPCIWTLLAPSKDHKRSINHEKFFTGSTQICWLQILSGVWTAAWETGSKTFTCTGSSVQFTTCHKQVAKSKTVVFHMAMYSTKLHSIAFTEIAASRGRVPRKRSPFSGFILDVNG